MDSSSDGGFGFLHSWSDDLDPAARRAYPSAGAIIDLDGVYLPSGDAPAMAARIPGPGAGTLAISALTVAAAWLLLRAP